MSVRSRITFLLPVTGDAHHRQRIDTFAEVADVRVLAFRRRFHDGKPGGPPVEPLGDIAMGRYGARLLPYLRALRQVRRAAAETDVFYVFGLDLAALCLLACAGLRRRPRLVHEVLDIRTILTGGGVAAGLLRRLDRWLAARADLMVVTSPEYLSGYYQGMLGVAPRRSLVVENRVRPDAPPPEPETDRAADAPLVIGYFGMLRCRRSLQILLRALDLAEGRLHLQLRGVFLNTEDLQPAVEAHPCATYGGPYVSPDELPAMYGGIDILWGCYPYLGDGPGNWQWARTKRFYEALRYGRPLFAAAGTRDAERAVAGGCGIELDLTDVAGAARTVAGMDRARLAGMAAAVRALPQDTHTETDRGRGLQQAVLELIGGAA